jgi:hypothetical protein
VGRISFVQLVHGQRPATREERRLVCEYYNGFSFGQFVRQYPDLRNTVTDLLIGDLFTDRVDKVWGPMESTYGADHPSIPSWHEGTPAEQAAGKANELVLPPDQRPSL